MSINDSQQTQGLKQALAEMHANQHAFSDEAFAQIMMVLLDKLRRLHTVASHTAAPAADEMRLLTIMFVDVKDSTELAHQLEMSDWKSVIDGAHQQIAQVIEQWEGQIAQYLGDGVLCYFGAQRSRGDDAHHAVSCALSIQSKIAQYAHMIQSLYDIEFRVRIGISTGRTVVGLLGSALKQERLALGLPTNRAARLQTLAQPGSVLVDSSTYNRIRSEFITQAMPPTEVKGFDKPMKMYHVIGRRPQPATQFTSTQINGIQLPLLGRDQDLAVLHHRYDTAISQQQLQAITLMGDIGIGKSRLLQEFVQLTNHTGIQILMSAAYHDRDRSHNLLHNLLTTQCHLDEGMSAVVMQQQISAYISELWDDDAAGQVAQALGYLAGFPFDKPQIPAADWVVRWFQGMAAAQPLLLVIDNLQWMDRESAALFEYVVQQLQTSPVLLLAAGRPGYRGVHPRYMAHQARHEQIELQRLGAESTTALIEHVLQFVDRAPAALAATIYERAEGNPFFVREFLSMLFDQGVFQQKATDQWRFNIILYDKALHTLPTGLISVLQARLDELAPEVRQIAQLAAVSGQTFWASAVERLTQIEHVSTLLDSLVMRGIVVEQVASDFAGEKQYKFQHTLYQAVAYEMLPGNQRKHLHEQLGYWLLERIAGELTYFPIMAQHFEEAEKYGIALYVYLEAVQDYIRVNRMSEALALVDRGLAIARNIPREEAITVVCKLWAWRGQILTTLEFYDEATAASQSALRLLQELPEDQFIGTRIMAERILALAYMGLGRYNEAYDALTRAHNRLPANATSELAAVLCSFGELSLKRGRLDDSLAYLKRAYQQAKVADDVGQMTAAQTQIGYIYFERGQVGAALKAFLAVQATDAGLVLPQYRVMNLGHLGLSYLLLMQYAAAIEFFAEAMALHNEINSSDEPDVLLQAFHALTYIIGLAKHGDYARCHEQAMSFVEKAKSVNQLLHARALRWLGVANHALGVPGGLEYLYHALAGEQSYGGREAWTCHVTIAQLQEHSQKAQEHYQKAAFLLCKHKDELADFPALQRFFNENPRVQEVFHCAKEDCSQLSA